MTGHNRSAPLILGISKDRARIFRCANCLRRRLPKMASIRGIGMSVPLLTLCLILALCGVEAALPAVPELSAAQRASLEYELVRRRTAAQPACSSL